MLNVVYLLLFNKNIFSLQFKVKYAKIKKLIYKIEGKLFNLVYNLIYSYANCARYLKTLLVRFN